MIKHLEKDSNRIQNNNDSKIDAKNSQTKYESVGLYLSVCAICFVPMGSKPYVGLSVANNEIEMKSTSPQYERKQAMETKNSQLKNANNKHVWNWWSSTVSNPIFSKSHSKFIILMVSDPSEIAHKKIKFKINRIKIHEHTNLIEAKRNPIETSLVTMIEIVRE